MLDKSIYVDFDTLADAYRPQIAAMIEEGVDALLIETCFDILQAKCVAITAIEEMKRRGVKLPLMVQLTIMQADQKMLPGTDIAGALTTLECFDEIDVIGLNCAVGPDLMLTSIRHLSQFCQKRISVLPNAGLPESRGEETYFPLQPNELADWLDRFVTEFGVNIVGGCCGTTRDHLAVVVDRLYGRSRPRAIAGLRPGRFEPARRRVELTSESPAAARRRAHQHQRLEEIQTASRKRKLGRPGRHGPRAGARRRPHP